MRRLAAQRGEAPESLTRVASKLGEYRVRRVALRLIRGIVVGTLRRAVTLRYLGELREWPYLRPGKGSDLWRLTMQSLAVNGSRAFIMERQSRAIEKALLKVAEERREAPRQAAGAPERSFAAGSGSMRYRYRTP